jgi:multidrug efflux pump subunit AcrA (membrane-fusion protein)
MKRVARRWVLLAAVVGTGLSTGFWTRAQNAPAAAAAPTEPSERNLRPAFTLPHKTYQSHFPTMGVIKEVKVKEGDVVKRGDILMKQDDSEEAAELKVLDAAVLQSAEGIKVGEAKLRVAQFEYEAKKNHLAGGGFNDLEVKQAEANRDVAAAQLEQARKELEQTKAKRDKQATHVKNMLLLAENDGVVKDLINDVGSNTDPTKPVLAVVQNDPLKVEVQVPALASLQMKIGDKLRVTYDKQTWREAAVSFLSPQADAASGMRLIQLELPNPNGEPSGLQAFVELPDKLLAAVDGK